MTIIMIIKAATEDLSQKRLNNCWLATNVVVTAGSKIENRVIVGANSVVGGKLESNSLYVAPRASRIMKL